MDFYLSNKLNITINTFCFALAFFRVYLQTILIAEILFDSMF